MKRSRVLSTALAATLAISVAACGSSSDDSSGGGNNGGNVEVDADGLATAKDRIAQFSPDNVQFAITEEVTIPDDVKVVFTQCSASACADIGVGIKEAVDAVGGELVIFNHKDTPDTVQAAFQNAVDANPDMVLTSGNPSEWFQGQLDELKSKNIPVVAWATPDPYVPTNGLTVSLIPNDDFYFLGVLQADYAVAKSDGNANVLVLNAPSFPVLATQGTGITEELDRTCPDCKVNVIDIPLEQAFSGGNVSAALAEIQKDPEIDWIIGTSAFLLDGLAGALENAGYDDIKGISAGGTPATLAQLQAGDFMAADIGLPSRFLGWRAVDAGFRAIGGEEPTRHEAPSTALVDGHPDILVSGVPTAVIESDHVVDPNVPWRPYEDYEDRFKALWGVD